MAATISYASRLKKTGDLPSKDKEIESESPEQRKSRLISELEKKLKTAKFIINGNIMVMNDSEIFENGGEMRGIYSYIRLLKEKGVFSVCMAASDKGYSQIALASVCELMSITCNLFVSTEKGVKTALTQKAMSHGAKIIDPELNTYSTPNSRLVDAARLHAKKYHCHYIEEGFFDSTYVSKFSRNVREVFKLYKMPDPDFIWVVAGTGATATALGVAFPNAQLNLVKIGRRPWEDYILQNGVENYTIHTYPGMYHEPAKERPPFKAQANYDAKVWHFRGMMNQGKVLIYIKK